MRVLLILFAVIALACNQNETTPTTEPEPEPPPEPPFYIYTLFNPTTGPLLYKSSPDIGEFGSEMPITGLEFDESLMHMANDGTKLWSILGYSTYIVPTQLVNFSYTGGPIERHNLPPELCSRMGAGLAYSGGCFWYLSRDLEQPYGNDVWTINPNTMLTTLQTRFVIPDGYMYYSGIDVDESENLVWMLRASNPYTFDAYDINSGSPVRSVSIATDPNWWLSYDFCVADDYFWVLIATNYMDFLVLKVDKSTGEFTSFDILSMEGITF